jgi:hypothetical protein
MPDFVPAVEAESMDQVELEVHIWDGSRPSVVVSAPLPDHIGLENHPRPSGMRSIATGACRGRNRPRLISASADLRSISAPLARPKMADLALVCSSKRDAPLGKRGASIARS